MKPKFNRLLAASITTVLALSSSAFAATFYWDDGTVVVNGASGGGTGAWTVGAAGWENGTSAQNWADGNDAVFGGTPGTVTLGGAITAVTVTFGSAGYEIATANNAMTWGALAGANNFTKCGGGTLTINGAGGYSGALSLTGGQITLGSATALGTGTVAVNNSTLHANGQNISNAVTLTNGGKLITNGGSTVSSAITLGTGGGNLAGSATDYGTFTGAITGGTAATTSLTINAGHVALSNTGNNFLGNISVSNYFLKPLASDVIPDTAAITIGSGGALKFQPTAGAGSYTETIAGLNGGGSGAWAEGTNVKYLMKIGSGDVTSSFGGVLREVGTGTQFSLEKIGSGILTLTGTNTYTGTTTINNGTLVVQGAAGWQTNGSRVGNSVVVNNGGTLKSGDHHQFGWTGSLANITVNSGGTFDQNGKDAYIGTLTLNGNASLTNGTATNQYLGLSGGEVTYIGTGSQQTTVATGLKLRDTGGGAVNAIFTVNGTNTAGDLVVSGAIQDGGGLTKEGTGTLVLSGANTYTGGTNVNAGKLVINGNTSATGAVAVGASGTLAGTGTVDGATTISGTHAVGSAAGSVGNQTFSNGVTYASGSIFSWDLNANAHGTKGGTYDGVLGTATANPGSIFNVVFGNDVNLGHEFWSTLHTTQTWAMTDIFTSFTGSFTTVTSTANAATQGAFTITGGGSTLTWTAVPEPTSALAGLLLAAGLFRRNRRVGFPQS